MTRKDTAPTDLALEHRSGLPDALRVLLKEYPRTDWAAHANFRGLVQFWLDRHMMFRNILETLNRNARQCHDGALDPQVHAATLARLGSGFVNELHGHHSIEDHHYFPVLARQEPGIARGFELLDHDHHDLDRRLHGFVERANAVLQSPDGDRTSVGLFLDDLDDLGVFLDRHLVDEEELVVPVILKNGAQGLG